MDAVAKLRNSPSSPRKMRLVADLIRGKDAAQALGILRFSKQEAARKLESLLRSALANWTQLNPDASMDDAGLYVSTIMVDGAGMLKRLRPAPQGRGHRIRKRSNHVTLVIGSKAASLSGTNTANQVATAQEQE